MFKTRFDRPATVMLSAIWALAAVLSASALAVSSRSWSPAPKPEVQAKNVERVTRSSMLGDSGLAIGKNKLE